jgi:coenzyme F420 hydrogenase subunit beta
VDLIKKNDLCLGCGLCVAISNKTDSKMQFNRNGFLRPTNIFDNNDDFNEKFKKFCPAYIIDHNILNKSNDYIWGSYEKILFGYSNNSDIRYNGSSGGVLSALLVYLLSNKEIDAIIHIGAKEDNQLINEIKLSTTVEDVLSNSGSRYSPSAPLENISDYLDRDARYAFVGKPCDVAALKMYSKINNKVNEKIKYIFSFFCAGVPSIKGTYKILQNFNVKESNVKEFKYRGEGWPGYTKVVTKDGHIYKMDYNESWGTILNKYLQKRCKICIDGSGEFADIACGDGWYGDEKGYPIFTEEDGRNIIMVRNSIGKVLIEQAVEKGYITIEDEINKEDLFKIQPFQFSRRATLISRIIGLKLMNKMVPKYSYKVMFIGATKTNPFKLLKILLGTIRRVFKGRL